jgi:ABC-type sugar transport system substrate-binding protein
MVFSLSACSAKDTEKDTDAGKQTTDTSKDEDTSKDTAKGRSLDELTVGFAQMDNTNSWRIAETNDMTAKLEAAGVKLVYADAGADTAKQASDIEDMVAQGVDYIVLPPQEEDGLQGALKAAMEAGIPVILVDRGVNGEAGVDYTTAIMSDFVWEGEQVGKKIVEETGGEGNVVILQGTQGATSTIDRQTGFTNAIEGTNLKVISDQTANYVMAEAQSVMENIIQANGDSIDVVYCHNDDMAIGAIAALKAAGYKPGVDVMVAGVDGSAAAMEAILAGEMLTTCSCSPFFGDIVLDTITKIEAGEEIPDFIVNQDTLYDINNADVSKGF